MFRNRTAPYETDLKKLINNLTGEENNPEASRLFDACKRAINSSGSFPRWAISDIMDQINLEVLPEENGKFIQRQFTQAAQGLNKHGDVKDIPRILLLFKRLIEQKKESRTYSLRRPEPKKLKRSHPDPPDELQPPRIRKKLDPNSEAELHLVQEVLTVLQGFESKVIVQVSRNGEAWFTCPEKFSTAIRETTREICMCGLHYQKVVSYIQESKRQTEIKGGLVTQAFTGALNEELENYQRVLVVLHTAFRRSLDPKCRPSDRLTLERLRIWIQEPARKLELLNSFCYAAKKVRGGALISEIFKFHRHGSNFCKEFTAAMLNKVCWPIFEMVRKWVTMGELQDPFAEFFVYETDAELDNLWTEKYKLNMMMIPIFISMPVAKNILSIGKTINFMRVCCSADEWVEQVDEQYRKTEFLFTNISELSHLVESMHDLTNKVLLKLIFEKYNFLDHVKALKKYLLLGQGDFIQCLLDLISPCLDQPASKVRQFTCEDMLRQAISMSNAQFQSQDVLHRLGVRNLDNYTSMKEQAWNVFCLKYTVNMPLNVILDEEVMNKYSRVFLFFLKLKRVKMKLSNVWKSHMYLGARREKIANELRPLLHSSMALRHEMWLLVQNMESYLMFDVLETAWKSFQADLEKVEDLNGLIKVHNKYMDEIILKSFLDEETSNIRNNLDDAFMTILQFCSHQENLHEECINLQTIQDVAKKGENGSPKKIPKTRYYDSNPIVTARKHIDQFNVFHLKFGDILAKLLEQLRNVEAFRSIELQLDYNEHYFRSAHQDQPRMTIRAPPSDKTERTSPADLLKKSIINPTFNINSGSSKKTATSRARDFLTAPSFSNNMDGGSDVLRTNQFQSWQKRAGLFSGASAPKKPPLPKARKNDFELQSRFSKPAANSFLTGFLNAKRDPVGSAARDDRRKIDSSDKKEKPWKSVFDS